MGTLKQSNVRFDSEAHRYYLGSLELRGITRLIGDRIGFPQSQFADPTLGTEVHEEIELMSYGIPPKTEHGKRFAEWRDANGVRIAANEYIVTDGEKYASPIDFVTENFDLWDIKTFRRMTREALVRVTYQLNIYAYLFKLMNGFEPGRLMVLQVNEDGCRETEIERLDVDEVKSLLYSEDSFRSSLIRTDGETAELAKLYDLQCAIEELESRKRSLEKSRDNLKEFLVSEMEKNGVLTWDTDRVRVSYVSKHTRVGVDVEALKEKFPSAYESTKKETEVKATVSVKLK